MNKIIISDASPLIAFARIKLINLLPDLFNKVIITEKVAQECLIDLSRLDAQQIQEAIHRALLSKKVDAVTGMMRNFELIQLNLAGHAGIAFYPEENGVPIYSELIFVANKNHLDDPRLKKFILAVKKGREYLEKHPEEAWKSFIKNHPDLNDELNKRAWFTTIPYFAKNPADFNQEQWLAFADFLLKNGLVKKVQPITMYAINLMKENRK